MKRGNEQEIEDSNCKNRNEKPQRARFSLESVKFFPELREKE